MTAAPSKVPHLRGILPESAWGLGTYLPLTSRMGFRLRLAFFPRLAFFFALPSTGTGVLIRRRQS